MEKRNKTSIEYRVGTCDLCQEPRLIERHHIFNFTQYGETHDGWTFAFCGSCHDVFHVALNSLVFQNKRATEVWEAFKKLIGENNPLIQRTIEKVYETAEITLEQHYKNYNSN